MPDVELHHGDCLDVLPTLASGSVDLVLCDPPYPHIQREYGYWTEDQWHAMMRSVVGECRRILKPKGSAVFILQPNSERVGRMRTWLWEFLAWTAREWNQVQDVWWWNTSTMPVGGANTAGLLRPSLKACVWLGESDCYRDQVAVLAEESARNRRYREIGNFQDWDNPCRRRSGSEGLRDNHLRLRTRCVERGGTTPFNVLATGSGSPIAGGIHGHGAATPAPLCDWWVRYASPSGGVVCDPFMGSGTVGLAALRRRRSFVGIERFDAYFAIARDRLNGPPLPLFDAPVPVVSSTPLLDSLPFEEAAHDA